MAAGQPLALANPVGLAIYLGILHGSGRVLLYLPARDSTTLTAALRIVSGKWNQSINGGLCSRGRAKVLLSCGRIPGGLGGPG